MFRRKHFLAPTHTLSPKIAYGIIAPVTFSPNEPRKKFINFIIIYFFVLLEKRYDNMGNLTLFSLNELKKRI